MSHFSQYTKIYWKLYTFSSPLTPFLFCILWLSPNFYLSGQSKPEIHPIDFHEKKLQNEHPVSIRLQLTDRKALIHCKNIIHPADILGNYDELFNLIIRYKLEYLEWVHTNQSIIKAIDFNYTKGQQESYLSFFDPSVNQIDLLREQFSGFSGLNQYVFLKEESPFDNDIDLYNKVITTLLSSSTADRHANDMATIISGLGNTFSNSLGVAPQTDIYTTDFQNLLPDPIDLIPDKPINVQNHSYGVGIENYYGIEAEAYDHATFTNPAFLPVFSAGNRGTTSSNTGTYAEIPGFATLSGTFKMAKNVMTVGAIDSFYQIKNISSKGPAYDGRIKPELVAFGFNGSSESAAIASGVASLVREALIENGHPPLASLIRAIMITGADDVMVEGPDFYSGFGNINAYKSLDIALNQDYLSDIIPEPEYELNVEIPADTRSFKVTLVWNDPPADLDAPKALVNDLDLKVITPADTVYPLVLDPSPFLSSLSTPATQGKDTLNTIEQVTIHHPVPGQSKIVISGPAFSSFSLAYSIEEMNAAQWTYPVSGTLLKSNERNILRWNASYLSPADHLEYKSTKDSTWQSLPYDTLNNIAPFIPDNAGEFLEFRLLFGTDTIVSAPVLVSAVPDLKLINSCNEYLAFEVKNDLEADSFALYKFTNGFFEIVNIQTSNILEYNGIYNDDDYFSAAPYYGNKPGIQGIALNIRNLFANCYINDFSGKIINNLIELTTEITIVQGVNSVIFEKLETGNYEVLEEIYLPVDNILMATDTKPNIGPNYYRVTYILENSTSISSEILEIYFIPQGDYLVFPSLVGAERAIFVLQQAYSPVQIKIYNSKGTLVVNEEILSTSDEIILNNLLPGLHYYNILNGKSEIIKSGKIVLTE